MGHGDVTRAQLERVVMRGERYQNYIRVWSILLVTTMFVVAAFCIGVYIGRTHAVPAIERALKNVERATR